jgi:NAD(P)-dependent dehydrogenase (short-subunit alcohol dehydrogenase family)
VPRTIVITGTSSGFGKLCVERFAAGGWNVAATVRKNTDPAAHPSKTWPISSASSMPRRYPPTAR